MSIFSTNILEKNLSTYILPAYIAVGTVMHKLKDLKDLKKYNTIYNGGEDLDLQWTFLLNGAYFGKINANILNYYYLIN